ncbi:MAG: amidohydrolase family protein [Gemmatimonadota bacterium]|nr:amidohydrolase family protein [Gemmatimonadota bacterium]MDH5759688.1 amidohydrolase family protein [Gemmatimonadota bacterium]
MHRSTWNTWTAMMVLAGALLPAGAAGSDPGDRGDGVVAFVNVNVLPMDRAGVVSGQTVVVRDGIIVAMGDAGTVTIPDDAVRIDGTGRFLMPGLAEMHAHVPPVPDPPRDQLEDILFLYVANGVTTIRGMLGQSYQLDLARELERGEILGPTLYVGAPSLSGATAPDPETAERMVRAHHAAGYDLQKIHPGLSLETWDRMTAVAREVGMTFGGHVPSDVGLIHAIETGMSTVDHLDGYVQAVAGDDVVSQINTGRPISLDGLIGGVDERRVDALVRLTLEHDVYVVPTLYLWENLYGTGDPEPFLRLSEMRYVSQAQRDAWRRQAAPGPKGSPDALEAFFDLRKHILGKLADAGAGILMGTDSPQMFNVPGFALHREIRLMADAGMTHHQILLSGTATVARYVADHLGLESNFGTVAVGNRADLVLLESNPLEALENLTDRVGVMVRGRWVTRSQIDAGLERLATKYSGGGTPPPE